MKGIWKLIVIIVVVILAAFDYRLLSFKGKFKVATTFVENKDYEMPMDAIYYCYAPYPFLDVYWIVVETKDKITVVTHSIEENKTIKEELDTAEENGIFSGTYLSDQPVSMLFYLGVVIFILILPRPKKERQQNRAVY